MEKKNVTYTVNKEQMIYDELMSLYNAAIDKIVGEDKIVGKILDMRSKDGSWRGTEEEILPLDIFVGYVEIPTVYATATLMNVMISKEGLSEQGKEALIEGLQLVTQWRFTGHGFEATSQLIMMLDIYKKAGMYEWIRRFGYLVDGFGMLVADKIDEMRRALATNRVFSDWNVDFTNEFKREVEDYDNAISEYVWYVAYGSNLLKDRFQLYIDQCTDQSMPVEEQAVMLPYNIYFASSSRIWNNGGTAFLDDTKAGMAYGRMYKIKRSQFKEIMRMEGEKYSKQIDLKLILHTEIPCYTFSSMVRRPDVKTPSKSYFNTIIKGLLETFPEMTETTAKMYLLSRGILSDMSFEILKNLRTAAHAVKHEDLWKEVWKANWRRTTEFKQVLKMLEKLGLVKVDSRSVAAGLKVCDSEALLYTVKEQREVIDNLLIAWTGMR